MSADKVYSVLLGIPRSLVNFAKLFVGWIPGSLAQANIVGIVSWYSYPDGTDVKSYSEENPFCRFSLLQSLISYFLPAFSRCFFALFRSDRFFLTSAFRSTILCAPSSSVSFSVFTA